MRAAIELAFSMDARMAFSSLRISEMRASSWLSDDILGELLEITGRPRPSTERVRDGLEREGGVGKISPD